MAAADAAAHLAFAPARGSHGFGGGGADTATAAGASKRKRKPGGVDGVAATPGGGGDAGGGGAAASAAAQAARGRAAGAEAGTAYVPGRLGASGWFRAAAAASWPAPPCEAPCRPFLAARRPADTLPGLDLYGSYDEDDGAAVAAAAEAAMVDSDDDTLAARALRKMVRSTSYPTIADALARDRSRVRAALKEQEAPKVWQSASPRFRDPPAQHTPGRAHQRRRKPAHELKGRKRTPSGRP